MRGRPSLRLKGTEQLKDVWIDASDDVCMYVSQLHPIQRHSHPVGTSIQAPP
jgi:hypothetical protein